MDIQKAMRPYFRSLGATYDALAEWRLQLLGALRYLVDGYIKCTLRWIVVDWMKTTHSFPKKTLVFREEHKLLPFA